MRDPVKETETLYKVKLPIEYREFLQKKKFAKADNRFSRLTVRGRHNQAIRFLVGASIFGVKSWPSGKSFVFAQLDRGKVPKSVIPFAAFDMTGDGDIDDGALAIDVSKENKGKCPVFQYEDGNLEFIANSIQEFLESLSADPPSRGPWEDEEDTEEDT